MIVPNKILPLKESVLGKVVYILDVLKDGEKTVDNLYSETSEKFEDINEFILAIDVLFLLNAIDYTQNKKVIMC